MAERRRVSRLFTAVAVLLGAAAVVQQAAALPGLPVIRWDPLRQVWVDQKTKGVVTVSTNTVTQPQGTVVAAAAAGPGFTQQGNTRAQKPSAREHFPLIIPDKDWWKTCDKNTSDVLTMMTTKCDVFKDIVNCQQLAQMGYLPQGIQSFVPHSMHGGFTIPNGCSSGNLGVEYDGLKMVFNSPNIPIMAVIAKDLLSKVFYFGSGVNQGRLLKLMAKKVEFCYAPPSISPLYVSKTAAYSTGMQPGSASWSFFKTAQLASPYTNNIASLFRGDTADVTWNLQVQKTGTDTVYQGAVTGQVTITNPQATPVTVYNINSYVQGGPSSTVSCGTQLPFQIPPCSSSVCNYVGYWPLAPAAGTYTNLADVSYTVGDAGNVGNQVGTASFMVGALNPAAGLLNTASGVQIQSGQAVVQDAMAPQQYTFSASASQSYTTQMTCPDTAIITNDATLTAATGQTIRQTATVQKLCFDLQVRVAQAASPFIGKWVWDVTKEASVGNLTLKPSATAWDKYVKQQMDLAIASGQDTSTAMELITGGMNTTQLSAASMDGSMTGEVTYKVTFTRTPPGGFVAGAPAFQAVGDVFITNTSPLNAQLKEVTVSISNPFGGTPYRTVATCPLLTVAAGQTLQCRYVASPPFNPVGAQVVGIAHYLNTRNGVPTGATTPFSSAPTTMAGGPSTSSAQPAPRVAPSASRHLLEANANPSSDVDAALSNIVRRVSVTNINGNQAQQHHGRVSTAGGSRATSRSQGKQQIGEGREFDLNAALTAMDGLVGAASSIKQPTGAGKLVADLLKGVVEGMANKGDKPESGSVDASGGVPSGIPAHVLNGLLKGLNISVEHNATSDKTIDVGEILGQLLPKLPSLGVNVEGGDWLDALGAVQHMLPKLPKLPSLPSGPTITINSTGPGEDDDYQEHEQVALSKALTRLTHLLEHNGKSTVTVTTKSLTPEGMLDKALEAIGHVKQDQDQFAAPSKSNLESALSNLDISDYDIKEQGQDGAVIPDAPTGTPSLPPTGPADLQGLSDECIDVKDAFAAGNGFTTGMIVSGSLPKGKVCDTTTFTYTVRYGPFAECFDRKAVNRAFFVTANTNTTGEASTTVGIKVEGCGPAVTSAVKSYASWARKGYSWTVDKTASPAKLALSQGQKGSVMYTVAYSRHETLVAPKLSATVQFDNLNIDRAVSLSAFSYKVTSQCPGGVKHKSGTFNCGANTIPAGGAPLTCKFKVDLPCSAPGVLVAHAAAGDKAVRSSAFSFPMPEATEMPDAENDDPLTNGECVMVTDEFKTGEGLVVGNITDTVPYGKLCGSKSFSYTSTFGPFKNCGKKKAINVASLSAGTPNSVMQSESILPIAVTGCSVYTPAKKTSHPTYNTTSYNATAWNATAWNATGNATAWNATGNGTELSVVAHQRLQQQQPPETPVLTPGQQHTQQPQAAPGTSKGGPMGANCVSPISFWKGCLHKSETEQQPQNGRCAVMQRLPGGPTTPFFPQPGVKHNRSYKGVMGKPTNTGTMAVDMWFKAAQALVATQLNELSGVVLSQPVTEAVSLIGSVVGTTSTTPPSLNMQLPGVVTAINLLEMFNSGQAGVDAC